MLGSDHLDKTQKHLGIQTVPEMLFGQSRLYVVCPQYNFQLSFSPLDCLTLCKLDEQAKRLINGNQAQEDESPADAPGQ